MAVELRPATIPADYVDLLSRPVVGHLTTLLPDGQPQTHPVWFDLDGEQLRINTMRQFRKARNMAADPRVTLLVIDPGDTNRWVEVRGTVSLSLDGAAEHLDGLAFRYLGVQRYFDCIPPEFATQTPVLGRITPLRVVTVDDATRQSRGERPLRRGPLPHAHVSVRPPVAVPASHRALLARPVLATLSTLLPGGHPQTQPIWFEFDGDDILFNTARERRKGRNLERDPRATCLVVDPADGTHWIELRGDVSLSQDGAVAHLDRLTQRYTGQAHFYGSIYPEAMRTRETRVVCRLTPRHIVCDPAHPLTLDRSA